MEDMVNLLKKSSEKADGILSSDTDQLKDQDNIWIQKVLLETDLDSVIEICASDEINSSIITSNLSKRVYDVVEQELGSIKSSNKNSLSLFRNKLIRFIFNSEIKGDLSLSDNFSLNNLDETKSSLYSLYKLFKKEKQTELLDFIETSSNEEIIKCLSLIIKSYDPLKAEKIIDRAIERLMFEYKSSLEIMKDVIISILENNSEDELLDILYA